MKKKAKQDPVAEALVQIQEQLAVLDNKFEQFMTKSLKELAEALAASRPAPRPQVLQAAPAAIQRPVERSGRPLYAIVCYACGKDAELPFKPSGDRPVYCKECFAKKKAEARALPLKSNAVLIAKPDAPQPAAKSPAKAKKAVTRKKAAVKKKSVKKTPKRK